MPFDDKWIPIILAVIAAAPGILALRSQFNKDKIAEREFKRAEDRAKLENQKYQQEMMMALIDPLKEQIVSMKETQDRQGRQIAKQAKTIAFLRDGITKLSIQIRELKHEPIWVPPDDDEVET